MQKRYLTFLSIILTTLALLGAPAVQASSLDLSPASMQVVEGETISVVINIDPQGEPVYTAKIEALYPADLLEVEEIQIDERWVPVVQTNLDGIDSSQGKITKTAGFPGGITTQQTFAIMTFSTIGSGQGEISIGGDVMILNADNNNTFAGANKGIQIEIEKGAEELTPEGREKAALGILSGAEVLDDAPGKKKNNMKEKAEEIVEALFDISITPMGSTSSSKNIFLKNWLASLVFLGSIGSGIAAWILIRREKKREEDEDWGEWDEVEDEAMPTKEKKPVSKKRTTKKAASSSVVKKKTAKKTVAKAKAKTAAPKKVAKVQKKRVIKKEGATKKK